MEILQNNGLLFAGQTWNFSGCTFYFPGPNDEVGRICPPMVRPVCYVYNGAVCCASYCPGGYFHLIEKTLSLKKYKLWTTGHNGFMGRIKSHSPIMALVGKFNFISIANLNFFAEKFMLSLSRGQKRAFTTQGFLNTSLIIESCTLSIFS